MVRKSEIERMKEITKLRVEFEEKREKEREVAARGRECTSKKQSRL